MRIVAVSDLHGTLPAIPPCDLLIIAGDICPDRIGTFSARRNPEHQKAWFDAAFRSWLAETPATHKIVTWGNHDWCGEACSFRRDSPQYAQTTDLQILVDEQTRVPIGDGDDGSVSVWASPWSQQFMDWAFMKEPADLVALYAPIPEGIDILVSHQPPFGYGDEVLGYLSGKIEHHGSRELLGTIERVRPQLVICGHIHEGHGRYEHDGVAIYNVSILDERYRRVHEPTAIEWTPATRPGR